MRVSIAPSILSANFLKLDEELGAVEAAGADLIHIDVMDGHFVPNITVGPLVVEAVRRATALPLDVHLMIENPGAFVNAFIDAGADLVTVHVETDNHLFRTTAAIKAGGAKAGVSLNPATPLETLTHILPEVDLVVIMTVNPGFGGQAYIPSLVGKIRGVRSMIEKSGKQIDLEVDGGIKAGNAQEVVRAGANILVMGTEIFHSGDYAQKMREVRDNLGS